MKRFIFAATGVLTGSLFGAAGAVVGGVGGFLIGSIEDKCRRCALLAEARTIPSQMRVARTEAEKMDANHAASIIKVLNPDGRKWWKDYERSRGRLQSLNSEIDKAKRCKTCENVGRIPE